jgi:hypothetical protein
VDNRHNPATPPATPPATHDCHPCHPPQRPSTLLLSHGQACRSSRAAPVLVTHSALVLVRNRKKRPAPPAAAEPKQNAVVSKQARTWKNSYSSRSHEGMVSSRLKRLLDAALGSANESIYMTIKFLIQDLVLKYQSALSSCNPTTVPRAPLSVLISIFAPVASFARPFRDLLARASTCILRRESALSASGVLSSTLTPSIHQPLRYVACVNLPRLSHVGR